MGREVITRFHVHLASPTQKLGLVIYLRLTIFTEVLGLNSDQLFDLRQLFPNDALAP